jgi:antitoxin (DNA-binding transcriptional repressor) of toxin-antitoxin stability system
MTTFIPMKTVGIREFRDKATHYLASGEILAVKRHGKVVGFYIPVSQSDEKEVQQAIKQLSVTVEAAKAESGLTEEALSQALNLSRSE